MVHVQNSTAYCILVIYKYESPRRGVEPFLYLHRFPREVATCASSLIQFRYYSITHVQQRNESDVNITAITIFTL